MKKVYIKKEKEKKKKKKKESFEHTYKAFNEVSIVLVFM